MKKTIYGEKDFKISKWAGGSTKELAIFPQGAGYQERDFIWRLSSATVDTEESTFTSLPDYDRVLLVLEGEAVLAHGDKRSVSLSSLEQDSFDGAVKTKCFGRLRDYNLMMRKGCRGRLEVISAKSEAETLVKGTEAGLSHAAYGFYCICGHLIVSIDGETTMVRAGEQLVMNCGDNKDARISFMGDGKGVMAEIFYSEDGYTDAANCEEKPEEIPEARTTADDFRAAFKLFHSKNRWSEALKRDKKDVWYDEALQRKLDFLERTYITYIIWIVGAVAIGCLAVMAGSAQKAVVLIVAWTVLHLLLIAPLVYMLILPKSIKAHIKDADSLNAREKVLHEMKLNEDEKTEKILKRYKKSGRRKYMGGDE